MRTFDTVEELLAQVQKTRKQARESVGGSQHQPDEFRHGGYFVNWTAWERYGFFIFGEVKEPQAPETDDPDELADHGYEVEYDQENRSAGFIFGCCYSQACPRGELGSTHVTRMAPISKETFDRAKANGWRHLNPSN